MNSEVSYFSGPLLCNEYNVDLGTEVDAPNSQVVPISQVVLKTEFTVLIYQLSNAK